MADMVALIRRRIGMGLMPKTLTELVERRGSVEAAAIDLAAFVGEDYRKALHAIEEVYGCGC